MQHLAKHKLFFIFLPIILVVCLEVWAHLPSSSRRTEEIQIKLEEGQSLASFSQNLAKADLVSHANLFRVYVRLRSNYRKFQAGLYLFPPSISPSRLIEQVRSGDIYTPVVFKFTVPEGASQADIFTSLESLGYSRKELQAFAVNKSFIKELGVLGSSLEGYLYPSTYRFYQKKPTAKELLQEMVEKFFKVLPNNYESLLKSHGFTLHQAVIIASLIEKETSQLEEKPLIAEVIKNRLKKRIKLGIDASVIYGIPNFVGSLTQEHLYDKKNLFNTRAHYGLPPGPIASPSWSSLEALINSSNEGYYYYVLKPGLEQKSHYFSKTLAEHRVFVKKLKASQQKLKDFNE